MSDLPSVEQRHLEPLPIAQPAQLPGDGARLPVPLTSFIGREQEIAAVVELLRRPSIRLVTVMGPGGVGKTRLALEVAGKAANDFPDGTFFVGFAAITDPARVMPTIAHALGVREKSGDIVERLGAFLGQQHVLLVLDNLEHVLGATTHFVELLAACPHLIILVTSRVVLRLSGEQVYPLSPLSLPDTSRVLTVDDLIAHEAIALFVERAQAVDPAFALTNTNASLVTEIVLRLDGLPLAIELAAARVRSLPLSELLARLSDQLQFLIGGARDAPARLRSMHDAIAWSHELLQPAEQVLFRRLAVFVGGFTLEAAEAVCGSQGIDDHASFVPSVLDYIESLVDQSLLQRVITPDRAFRYLMLETVREYAGARLKASGDTEAIRGAHAAHFLAMAEAADKEISAAAASRSLNRIAADYNNIRAVLAWANECGEFAILVRLSLALGGFWFYSGHFREGRAWFERAVALSDVSPDLRAEAVVAAASFAHKQGDLSRATALAMEGLTLADECGNPVTSAKAREVLGHIAEHEGDVDRAATWFASGLARAREADDPFWIAQGISNVGGSALMQGDVARAEAKLAESIARFQTLGHTTNVARDRSYLGAIARDRGEYARAIALLSERINLNYNVWGLHWVIGEMAAIAAEVGDHRRAARLFGATAAMRDDYGIGLTPATLVKRDVWLAMVRVGLSEAAFADEWAVGLRMSLAEAVAEARSVTAPLEINPVTTSGLTPREIEVLRLVAQEQSNREIAERLFISVPTVKRHITTIFGKLGVTSRIEAAQVARDHRVV